MNGWTETPLWLDVIALLAATAAVASAVQLRDFLRRARESGKTTVAQLEGAVYAQLLVDATLASIAIWTASAAIGALPADRRFNDPATAILCVLVAAGFAIVGLSVWRFTTSSRIARAALLPTLEPYASDKKHS